MVAVVVVQWRVGGMDDGPQLVSGRLDHCNRMPADELLE